MNDGAKQSQDIVGDKTKPIEPTFKHTGLDSPITEFALALAANKGDNWIPSGTAIVISPYLAITAKHVIEGFWHKFESSRLVADHGSSRGYSATDKAGTFSISAFQVLPGGTSGQLWSVTKIVLSTFTDVAFLHLTNPIGAVQGYQWRAVKMSLAPPPIGARVSGFGYRSPRMVVQESNDTNVSLEWHDVPTTTIGEVVEVFGRRRDSSMLSFPCYRTNARFEHGMSGGPVFNDQGLLCGLICSGTETETDYYSHATTLWPSMGTPIDIEREGQPGGHSYPVLELARDGYIRAEGWERVVLGSDEKGQTVVSFKNDCMIGQND
jgi:hypothetical protein